MIKKLWRLSIIIIIACIACSINKHYHDWKPESKYFVNDRMATHFSECDYSNWNRWTIYEKSIEVNRVKKYN